MARNDTAYVSAYDRTNVHVTDCFAYETFRLTANFNGAFPLTRSITSVKWQAQYSGSARMADCLATKRDTSILLTSQYSGPQIIKCTVTLDDGQKRVQQFRVNVNSQPYYTGDTWVQGPTQLTAIVPP